jgi:hypothetical protein
MKKLKIYFGCGLTHAPESFKQQVADFKQKIREMFNVEVLEFFGTSSGTSSDVYRKDIHECVKECDIMIGDCTYPSTGLGWEMGTSVEKYRKPVLAIASVSSNVTRLVVGAECEENPFFHFEYYVKIDDILPALRTIIENYYPTALAS